MFGWLTVLGLAAFLLALAAGCLWPFWRRRQHEIRLARAKRDFHRRREWLEAHFQTLASKSGKPRGLNWAGCDFDDAVAFARDRKTGDLCAFVGMSVHFEAVAGGDMEDNPNVGNLRAATAMFRWQDNQWSTEGRAIFNLNPAQAIQHFHHELEAAE